MKNNADVFAELTEATIAVKLPTINKDIHVRRLPFATVMRTLTQVAHIIETEFKVYGDEVIKSLEVLTDESVPASERGLRLAAKLFPMMRTVVAASPEIANGILKDVLPGISEETLYALPAEDATTILAKVLEAADKNVIVTQLTTIFFDLTRVAQKVLPKTEAPSEKKTKKPASESSKVE